MSANEVARLTGISYPTLIKWLDEERCECGQHALRERVCVNVAGQVWIKTPAFRLWMAGGLACQHAGTAPNP